jgi:ABC-type Fe3+-hydroxamate transport system substrate-binding protein
MGPRHAVAVRIVSLCPSITETVIDLGLASDLVGITRYCIHPASVVKDIPKVGGTKNPDIAAIIEASPDLVLANREENRREDYEALSAHVRVDASMPTRIGEVPGELRRLGALLGCATVAEARAAELEACLAELDRCRASFSFAYLVWRKPWMTVSGDTYVSDLFTRAGGRNVFAGAEARYPEITLDDLAARDPDVVFLPDEPFPFTPEHAAEISGAKRIELVSGDDCCWHGVRSIRGARWARAFTAGLMLYINR